MFIGVVLFFMAACNSPYTPKNKGYAQLFFPEKKYQKFDNVKLPFTFEYPIYAVINDSIHQPSSNFQKGKWLNIQFPTQAATLYISYIAIEPKQLDTLIKDAYNFANNHNNMASSINDSLFQNPQKVEGIFFTIDGNVATPYQFFLTDSTRHFFRGALYYDASPNQDSLAPVNAFILKDIHHLINTFSWKK